MLNPITYMYVNMYTCCCVVVSYIHSAIMWLFTTGTHSAVTWPFATPTIQSCDHSPHPQYSQVTTHHSLFVSLHELYDLLCLLVPEEHVATVAATDHILAVEAIEVNSLYCTERAFEVISIYQKWEGNGRFSQSMQVMESSLKAGWLYLWQWRPFPIKRVQWLTIFT